MLQKIAINGWLNLNKPRNITSAKAVAKVKQYLHPIKIGHGGTLDPLACGVLPLALGEATKTMQFCMDSYKEYEFTVKWGESTTTYDSEGEVSGQSKIIPSEQQILNILPQFIGEISQIPPIYSAIKINGKRAYDLARQGAEITLQSRKIQIHKLELLYELSSDKCDDFSTFRVSCGKGTYIRSLAIDIAAALNTLAHVTKLMRTRVGNFSIKDAIFLEDLEKTVYKDALSGILLPVDTVLDDIQVLEFTPEYATKLRQGQKILLQDFMLDKVIFSNNFVTKDIFVVKCDGSLVAVCKSGEGLIKPIRVFNL